MGLDEFYAGYLVGNYGRQTDQIIEIIKSGKKIDPEIDLALAELEFTIQNEGVHTLMDFFERRTGRLYFHIDSINKLIDPVLVRMEKTFNWDKNRIQQETEWVRKGLELASHFVENS